MCKCYKCKHMWLKKDETGQGWAKCTLIKKGPRSEGKVITWACTTFKSWEAAFFNDGPNYGYNRVLEYLKKRKTTPRYCPLLKN
jgi:hypothetical protein